MPTLADVFVVCPEALIAHLDAPDVRVLTLVSKDISTGLLSIKDSIPYSSPYTFSKEIVERGRVKQSYLAWWMENRLCNRCTFEALMYYMGKRGTIVLLEHWLLSCPSTSTNRAEELHRARCLDLILVAAARAGVVSVFQWVLNREVCSEIKGFDFWSNHSWRIYLCNAAAKDRFAFLQWAVDMLTTNNRASKNPTDFTTLFHDDLHRDLLRNNLDDWFIFFVEQLSLKQKLRCSRHNCITSIWRAFCIAAARHGCIRALQFLLDRPEADLIQRVCIDVALGEAARREQELVIGWLSVHRSVAFQEIAPMMVDEYPIVREYI